jgi:hypothetical protein
MDLAEAHNVPNGHPPFVSTEGGEDDAGQDDDEPMFKQFYGNQSEEIFNKTFINLVNLEGTALKLRFFLAPTLI